MPVLVSSSILQSFLVIPLSKDLKLQQSFLLIQFFKVATSTQEREKQNHQLGTVTKTSHEDNHSPLPRPHPILYPSVQFTGVNCLGFAFC